jgi:hypothetical protein|nr:MAG TPA: hypothetical protein [Caudoviricetes sp.]
MPDEELEKRIKLELALIHQCEESDIIICHIDVLTDCFKFYVIYRMKYSLCRSITLDGLDICKGERTWMLSNK